MNDLIQSCKISDLVEAHDQAIEEVEQAFSLLTSAKQRLAAHFGEYCNYIWRGQQFDDFVLSPAKSKQLIKKQAWDSIIKQTNVREIASTKQVKEIDAQIEAGELPPVTVENVETLLNRMLDNLGNMLQESIQEAYDELKRHCYHLSKWATNYKTNEKNAKFDIGKKLILEYACEHCYGGGYSIRYHKQELFRTIDRAFHVLAGRGVPRYPDCLVSLCQKTKGDTVETDFFKLKFYNKGTVHLEFKDDKLLREFNKQCSNCALKGR